VHPALLMHCQPGMYAGPTACPVVAGAGRPHCMSSGGWCCYKGKGVLLPTSWGEAAVRVGRQAYCGDATLQPGSDAFAGAQHRTAAVPPPGLQAVAGISCVWCCTALCRTDAWPWVCVGGLID